MPHVITAGTTDYPPDPIDQQLADQQIRLADQVLVLVLGDPMALLCSAVKNQLSSLSEAVQFDKHQYQGP